MANTISRQPSSRKRWATGTWRPPQELLAVLIDEYISNLPEDLIEARIADVRASGDEIYFSWMGSTTEGIGNPHYYRVQGKEFLIEYDNIQNNANHVHSVWRDYKGDFGRDVLAAHHASDHR